MKICRLWNSTIHVISASIEYAKWGVIRYKVNRLPTFCKNRRLDFLDIFRSIKLYTILCACICKPLSFSKLQISREIYFYREVILSIPSVCLFIKTLLTQKIFFFFAEDILRLFSVFTFLFFSRNKLFRERTREF